LQIIIFKTLINIYIKKNLVRDGTYIIQFILIVSQLGYLTNLINMIKKNQEPLIIIIKLSIHKDF